MTLRQKFYAGLGFALLVAAAFLAGRFTAHPAKVVEHVTDTVQVQALQTEVATLHGKLRAATLAYEASIADYQARSELNRTKRTTYHKAPTGEITIERVEETHATSSSTAQTSTEATRQETREAEQVATSTATATSTSTRTTETEKETTWAKPGWRFAGHVGIDLTSPGPLLYQGEVSRRLFGTLWLDVNVDAGGGSWRAFAGPALEF